MHAEFELFFKEPTHDRLEHLLENNLGEHAQCDFKAQWSLKDNKKPDWAEYARDILALANSGGGCLILGVEEQKQKKVLISKGLSTLIDGSDVTKGLYKYLPRNLRYEFGNFSFKTVDEDTENKNSVTEKRFQVFFIWDEPTALPFLSTGETEGLLNNAIYVRRGTSSTIADHHEVQSIVNRRIETGYSSRPELDLRSHLKQLRILIEEYCEGYNQCRFTRYGDYDRFETKDADEEYASALYSFLSRKQERLYDLLDSGLILEDLS